MNIDLQIKSAKRELAMRRRVYPRWIATGKMNQAAADHEIEAMAAIVETLEACREAQIKKETLL